MLTDSYCKMPGLRLVMIKVVHDALHGEGADDEVEAKIHRLEAEVLHLTERLGEAEDAMAQDRHDPSLDYGNELRVVDVQPGGGAEAGAPPESSKSS